MGTDKPDYLKPAYWRDQQNRLWQTDVHTLPKPRAALLVAMRIFIRLVKDFMQGQLTLRAMSLVYTTLLSLVPLLALSFSVLKAFGIHNQLEPLLLNFLAPFGEKGTELAMQIVQFVENIGVGVLGSLGLLLLVYTVISLIQKVETSLNYIWHVTSLRNLSQRLSGYLSVVMVGPLLIVTALGITGSVMNTSLVQQIVAIEPFGSVVIGLSKLVPYLLVIGAFTATYLLIPNTNVKFKSALLGGIFAGVLWESVGWGFASFIVGSTKYAAIYSGFAIIILFLIWLYLNWLVLLLGASIAFYYQNPAYQVSGTYNQSLGSHAREALALEIMRLIGSAYQDGSKEWSMERLIEQLTLPMELVNDVLNKLLAHGLLVYSGDEDPYFIPGKDLQNITVKEVLDVIRGDFISNGSSESFADKDIIHLLRELDTLSDDHLANKTIRDLVTSKQG
ncbi:YihY/virulence factor BrkB family protein [Kaarinaea lacus]